LIGDEAGIAVTQNPAYFDRMLPTFTAPCKDVLDQYAAAFRKVVTRHKQLTKV